MPADLTAPMSDADRAQVALSTAEARVEELEGEVARLKAELATERAAWIDLRADVLQGGWTGGDAIEINDVLHKIDEYMPDACVAPGVKEPTDAR